MDSRLLNLVREYQFAAKAAIDLMVQSGISLPSSNRAWSMNDVPNIGVLARGIRYRKHGYGCEVFLPDIAIDFDFGDHGEYDGFDLWRIRIFAGERLTQFGISSGEELDGLFKEAVRTGALVQSNGTLYYLRHRPFGII
ncbi:DUF6896 domain-containing protein [Dyella psychrodurans]|nr:hypothetical protein [Dyella psychrodurans]